MSEVEALEIAIDAMQKEAHVAAPMARDWRTYGKGLLFNQTEARMAAERADRLTAAIAVLQAVLKRQGIR